MSRARKLIATIGLVAVWALMGSAGASATSCANTQVQVSGLTQGQMEDSILCLINEQRTSRGIGAVQPNDELRQAALSHSKEMIDEGYFEHTSPSGLSFVDRIERYGYLSHTSSWIVGENLVWGSGSLSSPGALVTSWMNSPPHRENLLNPKFRQIGIAAVVGTPVNARDANGVTVSSEYGKRARARRAHASRAKKARKRRLAQRRARAA